VKKIPAVLHLDIDAFFAAVEVQLNPGLRGKPVIVGGLGHERGVVCTASYEARRFGVHSGMALRTARNRCPQAVFLRGRHRLYCQISEKFFACLRRFSPQVEEVSIDEAYVDLSGSRYLSPSLIERAEAVKAAAERETGLAISAGLASSRLGAKLASEAAKPGGFCRLEDEEEFIASLAVDRIPGVGPQTAFILQGLGVSRVSDLQRRYPSLWKKIFAGHDDSRQPLGERRAAKSPSFSRETTFPSDISDRELIAAHLAYLTDRLAVHLATEQLFAGRLEVKVRFSDFSTFGKRTALPFPTFAHAELFRAVAALLPGLLERKRLPLRLVGVKVEDLSQERDILPFFSLRGESLTRGLADVKERYGFSAILTGRERLLEDLYPMEREGLVLKTASLTK